VGIPPSAQAHGWRVRSTILSLDELLAVAASIK
jgi:hypothetical protein